MWGLDRPDFCTEMEDSWQEHDLSEQEKIICETWRIDRDDLLTDIIPTETVEPDFESYKERIVTIPTTPENPKYIIDESRYDIPEDLDLDRIPKIGDPWYEGFDPVD